MGKGSNTGKRKQNKRECNASYGHPELFIFTDLRDLSSTTGTALLIFILI